MLHLNLLQQPDQELSLLGLCKEWAPCKKLGRSSFRFRVFDLHIKQV